MAGNVVPAALRVGYDLDEFGKDIGGTPGSATIASGAVLASFWELYKIYGLSGLSLLGSLNPSAPPPASPFSTRGAAITAASSTSIGEAGS